MQGGRVNMQYFKLQLEKSIQEAQKQGLAKNDPELFLNQYETPVILDEIQHAPNLMSYIKMRLERSIE